MADFPENRELILDRRLDAPRAAVFRCWIEPELVKRWFAPAPWTVAMAVIDPRVGGAYDIAMRGPDGQDMPGEGVLLDIIADRRIVMTDAFSTGFVPRDGAPFMVASIDLSDEDGGTRYVARARHWTAETCAQHAAMGFHTGWNQCADQLEALARTL